jgi:hypothetical protein
MKKYIFALLVLGLAACGESKQEQNAEEKKDLLSTELVNNPRSAEGTDSVALNEMATMDFKDTSHDFGNLIEGEVGTYDFEFMNNGKSPLIINNATGSCGCTVPEYPRDPIAPGKGGIMKVKFNSADKKGHQEKSVSINTNSKKGLHMLYIKAQVNETK